MAPIGRAKPNWLIDSSVTMYSAAARSIACRCSSARISFSRTPWSLSTPIDAALRAPADGSHACSLARAGVGVCRRHESLVRLGHRTRERRAVRRLRPPARRRHSWRHPTISFVSLWAGLKQTGELLDRAADVAAAHPVLNISRLACTDPRASRHQSRARRRLPSRVPGIPGGRLTPLSPRHQRTAPCLTRGGRRPGQEKGGRCPDLPRGP